MTFGGAIVFKKLLVPFAALTIIACTGVSSQSLPASTRSLSPASVTPASPPPPSAARANTQQPAETASMFTSLMYPYSIALAAGWHAGPAMLKWDGVAQPGYQEPTVDKFGGSESATAFSFAGPTKLDLNALVQDRIDANFRDHGDTCKETPDVNEATTVGRDPAVFLAWNCGILINQVVAIHHGFAFAMVMRDVQVHAATDPADRTVLDMLLRSVTFSN